MNIILRKNGNQVLSRPRDVFGDFLDLRREMSDWFDHALDLWPTASTAQERSWTPAVDVIDQKDSLVVKADLPGLKKEDIDVTIEDGILRIRGEKKGEHESREKGHHRFERFYGVFERSVALPAVVDESKTKAAYKDGVLELSLPKREEAKPKSLKVDIQ